MPFLIAVTKEEPKCLVLEYRDSKDQRRRQQQNFMNEYDNIVADYLRNIQASTTTVF